MTEIDLLVFLEIDPAVTSFQETNENSANGMVCRRHPCLLHQRGGAIDKLFNESYEVIRHIPSIVPHGNLQPNHDGSDVARLKNNCPAW